MKLFEHQAKEAFAAAGIPVPRSSLATDADGATAAARDLGFPCVLKSQVLRGGRGKAGLIKLVRSADEARAAAEALFSSAHGVRKVLVEEAVDIETELYLSILADPRAAKAL
ncbi:MAG: acetate--CoA ligase family protein, partial [Spirochaetaceae bacterium]|nr:acetate--CoA ligase family protein [Spirochaetaceae bacterium]